MATFVKVNEKQLPEFEAFPQFILLRKLGHYTWWPGHNPNDHLKSHKILSRTYSIISKTQKRLIPKMKSL